MEITIVHHNTKWEFSNKIVKAVNLTIMLVLVLMNIL